MEGRAVGEGVGPGGGAGGFCADAIGAKSPVAKASPARMRLCLIGGILGAPRLMHWILGVPFVGVKAFEGAASRDESVIHRVRTTRNWAWPLVMRAYASFTLASGNFSIIGRMPESSAKRRVSSESVAMPEAQP